MPERVGDHEAVQSGRLSPADIYQNARYDAGYRLGWRDAHRQKRPSHRGTRDKYAEYAKGYDHGWDDGQVHPCPEWDDAHRAGPRSALPDACPWSPVA